MLILSVLAQLTTAWDVALTMKIIRAGRGREMMPVNRLLIRLTPWLAYVVSLGLTAIWCAIMLPWRYSTTAIGWVTAAILFRLFCIALNYHRAWRR